MIFKGIISFLDDDNVVFFDVICGYIIDFFILL